MKIRGVSILLFFCLLCSSVRSQDILEQYVPLPPQELSVAQYLFHIEQVINYPLAYSTAIVEDKTISIYSDSLKLRELLDTLFTKHSIKYLFYNKQLILSPTDRNPSASDFIQVSGIIRNARNGKIIPYANIFIRGQSIGTIANSEGGFELYLPVETYDDTLWISCLGYLETNIPVSNILSGSEEILLKPLRFQIDELIVRPLDPLDIIRQSLKDKGKNYGKDPALLTAFFREVTKQNDRYISLSEAIIDIYKTSYLVKGNDLVKLKKGRKGSNMRMPENINMVVKGGLYNNMQLDLMKYGIDFLNPEMFGYYTYSMQRQFTYNGRQTYLIGFEYKGSSEYIGFNGKLYFDVQSLALVRSSFRINESSLAQAYSWLVKKVPKNQKVRPKFGKYAVEYRYYDNKWNLSYARSEISFKLRKKREWRKTGYNCNYTAASEFVITGKTQDNFEKIRYRDAAKPGDILLEEIQDTDLKFWGYETIIIPEEPLLETIEKLHLATDSSSSGTRVSQEKP